MFYKEGILMEKKYTETLYIRVDKELLESVDNYRRKQKEIPTVSDAIRQLIRLGLLAPTPD